jgi:hypothetical protein
VSDEKNELKYRLPARLRLFVLEFVVGSLLSLPIRLAFRDFRYSEPYFEEPPKWAYELYYLNWVFCLILLPFWTSYFLNDQPEARQVGRRVWNTFRLLLLLVLMMIVLQFALPPVVHFLFHSHRPRN